MDREIKVRAWDKNNQEMAKIISIELKPDQTYQMLTVQYSDGEVISEYLDSFELLWCTGLTDKKGTEIYEGDVVEDDYIAISEDRSQVYFQNGAFWVNYGGAVKLLADRDMRHIKVIGNKFEDPELLNDNE